MGRAVWLLPRLIVGLTVETAELVAFRGAINVKGISV